MNFKTLKRVSMLLWNEISIIFLATLLQGGYFLGYIYYIYVCQDVFHSNLKSDVWSIYVFSHFHNLPCNFSRLWYHISGYMFVQIFWEEEYMSNIYSRDACQKLSCFRYKSIKKPTRKHRPKPFPSDNFLIPSVH